MTRNKLLEFIDFGSFGVVEQFFSVLKTKGSRINCSATSKPPSPTPNLAMEISICLQRVLLSGDIHIPSRVLLSFLLGKERR
jgi:hypothetical protein